MMVSQEVSVFHQKYAATHSAIEEGEIDAADLLRLALTDVPEVAIDCVGFLQELLRERERQLVPTLRAQGWSWRAIGEHLGRTRQALHQQYGGDADS